MIGARAGIFMEPQPHTVKALNTVLAWVWPCPPPGNRIWRSEAQKKVVGGQNGQKKNTFPDPPRRGLGPESPAGHSAGSGADQMGPVFPRGKRGLVRDLYCPGPPAVVSPAIVPEGKRRGDLDRKEACAVLSTRGPLTIPQSSSPKKLGCEK